MFCFRANNFRGTGNNLIKLVNVVCGDVGTNIFRGLQTDFLGAQLGSISV